MSKDTSGPAFPFMDSASPKEHSGMSLRQWYAGLAMQGWFSSYPSDMEADNAIKGAAVIARVAYAIADAMIAEGSK